MSAQIARTQQPTTAATLRQRKVKNGGQPMAVLTAYDFTMAKTLDAAGVEVLLVGDSLAQTLLGHANTLSVTMDEMLHHVKAVSRGVAQGSKRALVVADMPFLSYGTTVEDGVTNAGRMIQEGGAQAVKLEGASPMVCDTIRRLTQLGIPVMGHLGLTPQAIHQLGGYKVQGKTPDAACQLLSDARLLQACGAFSLVLEMVPTEVADVITQELAIPTIGIGAGVGCDGQVLVIDDVLGRFTEFQPKFVRRYANLADTISQAVTQYQTDVVAKTFPAQSEAFTLPDDSRDEVLVVLKAMSANHVEETAPCNA